MINLFDTYHQKSWDLHFSLLKSGYQHPTVVLEDNGWLPEDVTSPYQFMTGYQLSQGEPLYFNQLAIPDFWEIRGNSQEANVWDYHQRRAAIHYATPKHRRFIQQVDWFDKSGKIISSDHYNRKGYRFAQSIYDAKNGELLSKSYYDAQQKEVVVENYKTGDVIINYKQQVSIFPSQVAFYAYYLKEAGFQLDRIFYNSLGKSFLTAFESKEAQNNILFWQEGIGEQLPANMTFLLDSKTVSTQIAVQDSAVFKKIKSMVQPKDLQHFSYLGFLYPFKPNQSFYPEALIVTNSDQIEQVEELIKDLPELTFNIAAVTEMSSKLVRLKTYDNVRLYPNSSPASIEELFKKSSFYLDINYGRELLSACRTAFERELLLFSFDKTAHNRHYVSSSQVFQTNEREKLVATLRACLTDRYHWYSLLENQREHANVSTIDFYQQFLG
ncbi:accessory Sec system glycosylation chaperone GtfB [Streptococcus cuniculipharyngis]|uniref:UDP-N-acetylglucosamine--peptide N-acetylglucosaminyltransferase stabilizing protein GtfB n=1 Tax=Streptococcus cuniculipharyngis TaxID=1562651 RepID=A0A5C5SF14_9STRE|nr:accessory Sec system glycosylation chaperone GtfB [Streptococcus cuniculipharyngis]TWS98890.1 accessory Sec system glycosylation chaperone GtfB [Streptococcus cuniculipharyngis]